MAATRRAYHAQWAARNRKRRSLYQAQWAAQKRAADALDVVTASAAARDALDRCPTCGVPWPEDVPADQLTPCEDQ